MSEFFTGVIVGVSAGVGLSLLINVLLERNTGGDK